MMSMMSMTSNKKKPSLTKYMIYIFVKTNILFSRKKRCCFLFFLKIEKFRLFMVKKNKNIKLSFFTSKPPFLPIKNPAMGGVAVGKGGNLILGWFAVQSQ